MIGFVLLAVKTAPPTNRRVNLTAKEKVGEEAIETVIAAKNRDKNEIVNETSDLLYHLLVMLAEQEIEIKEVVDKLIERHYDRSKNVSPD
ncbi:MAG: phosphoribosyl-ATP diphosphatase [Ignavibacteriales bacterium]|nr:phosphoribosyl-ATP diphosphatase [Ignavibacteriales bacterium]